jgi:predicted O-linked N-acetylglucosamine transferase (SPINDLY family)
MKKPPSSRSERARRIEERALALYRAQPALALSLLRQSEQLAPLSPAGLAGLAHALLAAGEWLEAERRFRAALHLAAGIPAVLDGLGRALYGQGRIDEAIDCLRGAIDADASLATAQEQLGVALIDKRDYAAARQHFEAFTRLQPGAIAGWTNLGNAALCVEDTRGAAHAFSRALELDPEHSLALEGLATAAWLESDFERAFDLYHASLISAPGRHEARIGLANVLAAQKRYAEAVPHLEQALRLAPGSAPVRENLGNVLVELDRIEEARDCYMRAVSLGAKNGVLARAALLVPAIAASRDDIQTRRAKMGAVLEQLEQTDLKIDDPLLEVGRTNFYLAYHALDNRDLHQRWAGIFRAACPALECVAPHVARYPGPGGRIRIGIISKFLHDHSIGRTSRGFFDQLDRRRFEVSALFVPPVCEDALHQAIRSSADRAVILPHDLAHAREIVAGLALDVLFYQDIGMEPFSYFLAFARLAPVQCVSYGHPDTSGIPNMDYFVSTELFEPPQGQQHYSERLVQLRDVGTLSYYYRPDPRTREVARETFGLPAGRRVYLCPQALFKLHPDFDSILRGILTRDPDGMICLIEAGISAVTERLRERQRAALGGLANRVLYLPRCATQAFVDLVGLPEVMLDTPGFNGMNTSLQAFARGTPVVTLPGEFQRCRHTYGMYRKMRIEHCVARDPEHYADLAVEIARDGSMRRELSGLIEERSQHLFEDRSVIEQFERFFESAVDSAARR